MPAKPNDIALLVQTVISLTPERRKRFFELLEREVQSCDDTGFVILPKSLFELFGEVRDMWFSQFQLISDQLINLANELARRNRKPDMERLRRGSIILEAQQSGISWQKMPGHVLSNHPDWFPELKRKTISPAEKDALREQLRRMARDAKTRLKLLPLNRTEMDE